jgi:chromosome partitioning protein
LALFEKKTLLIDCDPQGCSTRWSGIDEPDQTCGIVSVLSAKTQFADAIVKTQSGYMDVLPAGLKLFQVALKLSKTAGNEKLLRLFIKDVEDQYEYIVIDAPSSYSFLSISAMTAADWLLVCMTPDQNSIDDFQCLLETVKYIQETHQVPLKIFRVLFNRCTSQEQVDSFLKNQDLSDIQQMVCRTFVPEDENIKHAIQLKIPAVLHDLKSPAAQACLGAAREMEFFFTKRGV